MKKVIIKFLIKHKLIQELDLVTILKLVKSDYIKRNKKRKCSSGICHCVEITIRDVLCINNKLKNELKITIMNYISIAAFNRIMAIDMFWFNDNDHNSRINTLNKAINYYKKHKINIVLLWVE